MSRLAHLGLLALAISIPLSPSLSAQENSVIRIEGVSGEWVTGHVRAGQAAFAKEVTDAGFQQAGELRGLLKESYFLRFEKAGR